MSPFGRTAMLPVLICACARAPAHPEISEVPVSAVREQGEPPAQSGLVLRLYHDAASTLSQPGRKVVRDSAGWVEAASGRFLQAHGCNGRAWFEGIDRSRHHGG